MTPGPSGNLREPDPLSRFLEKLRLEHAPVQHDAAEPHRRAAAPRRPSNASEMTRRGGKRAGAGRKGKWSDGHLVSVIKDGLQAIGSNDSPKAVRALIKDIRHSMPDFYSHAKEDTLRRQYFKYRHRPTSVPTPVASKRSTFPQAAERAADEPIIDAGTRERWISLLLKWGKEPKLHPIGMSVEQAHELINSLIAVGALCRAYLDQLFVHMERRLHCNGKQRIEWIQKARDRLAANPIDWPVPPTRRGQPNISAGLVLDALSKGPATNPEVVARTRLKRSTVQNLLISLFRAEQIVRVGFGRYALPAEGLAGHVSTRAAILDALSGGPASPAELRARTGKSGNEIAGGVHRLKEAEKIILTKRGVYSLAGTASPHVYARDAIKVVLQSGPKTISELIVATGKNRKELYIAARRLEANDAVKRIGRRGRFRVFALVSSRRKNGNRAVRRAPRL
jgi:hypothetical protein